jgi:hypothetical protein
MVKVLESNSFCQERAGIDRARIFSLNGFALRCGRLRLRHRIGRRSAAASSRKGATSSVKPAL